MASLNSTEQQRGISVSVQNLTKTYGKNKEVLAVDSVSFEVKKGELFGLIGPDGAGKTSIFRMLTTLLFPDSGSATVDGFDIVKDYRQIRNTVGYMPGRFSLYQDLTIAENLHFFATLFGTTVEENYHLIKDIYVQIEKFKTRRAGKLSGGMKQKLALCCALIHKPTVLFLDEPTTGVDPVSRKEFWEMLKRLKEQEISIVVSTPYMDEATMCDRIALIQGGKILSLDTPDNIIGAYPDTLFAVRSNNMYDLLRTLPQYENIKAHYAFGEFAHVSFKSGNASDLEKFLKQKGLSGIETKTVVPNIEDAFIKMLQS
ncbi:ABC transporter ATP-binding protein [Flavobacterium sp. MAH-1]|uniref:ABC transporter ATP-binding protein n=1 Tax=Flavobacterium agri TaxID=2743471 RepID=A0A7Y8Y0Y4_9FLAO|nr:ABC transporter ATP-binding protein [Flavobacterium agri]NUY80550.1 ABC transporter ATP-binding protein [Flavobacterium agri]NYA70574.1 ABC transporter ATP-binding protein [Flavobacterium agri]